MAAEKKGVAKPIAYLKQPNEPVADLAVTDSKGWPLVRGGWVNTLPHFSRLLGIEVDGYSGEIRSIEREVDGRFAGRVLVLVRESGQSHDRVTIPEHCVCRKKPRERDTATQLFGNEEPAEG